MFRQRLYAFGLINLAVLIGLSAVTTTSIARQKTTLSPSDTVREFYKNMRERKFREAWALTIYKSAVEPLTAQEMEDLRPDFEERASKVPNDIEIINEQVNGGNATVFVKVPSPDGSGQVTSEPVLLISTNGQWIIGTTADQAVVQKAGRRFFLDAMLESHEAVMEDFLKRLIGVEVAYSLQHEGVFGDISALIASGLMSHDITDPTTTGFNVHIVVSKDGKGYTATAEPARYGHTAKLSFWMDQTGAIKKADNGGKPTSPK